MPHHATNSILLALSAAVPVGVSSAPLLLPPIGSNTTAINPHHPHVHFHTKRITEWQKYKADRLKPPPTPTQTEPPKPAGERLHCKNKNGKTLKPPCHPYTPSESTWKLKTMLVALALLAVGVGSISAAVNGRESSAVPTSSATTATGEAGAEETGEVDWSCGGKVELDGVEIGKGKAELSGQGADGKGVSKEGGDMNEVVYLGVIGGADGGAAMFEGVEDWYAVPVAPPNTPVVPVVKPAVAELEGSAVQRPHELMGDTAFRNYADGEKESRLDMNPERPQKEGSGSGSGADLSSTGTVVRPKPIPDATFEDSDVFYGVGLDDTVPVKAPADQQISDGNSQDSSILYGVGLYDKVPVKKVEAGQPISDAGSRDPSTGYEADLDDNVPVKKVKVNHPIPVASFQEAKLRYEAGLPETVPVKKVEANQPIPVATFQETKLRYGAGMPDTIPVKKVEADQPEPDASFQDSAIWYGAGLGDTVPVKKVEAAQPREGVIVNDGTESTASWETVEEDVKDWSADSLAALGQAGKGS